MKKAGLVALRLLVAGMLVSAPARADTPSGARSSVEAPSANGFSAWGILGWASGLGLGGRYMLPVMDQGLLQHPEFKDRLAAEFGLDMMRWSYGFGTFDYAWMEIRPTAGLLWTVWLNENFAVYPKLDLGYEFGWVSGWEDAWGNTPSYGGFYWEVLGGVMYKMGAVTLRAELGNIGLKAGVGFGF
jgi:hypothetical protein